MCPELYGHVIVQDTIDLFKSNQSVCGLLSITVTVIMIHDVWCLSSVPAGEISSLFEQVNLSRNF